MKINLREEDFGQFICNDELSLERVRLNIDKFQEYLNSSRFLEFIKDRDLYSETIERLLVSIIRHSSKKYQENETLNREDKMLRRHKDNIFLDQKKSTNKANQYKMQLIDYLLYGEGARSAPLFKRDRIKVNRKASQSKAIRIVSQMLYVLGLCEPTIEEKESVEKFETFKQDFMSKLENTLHYSYVSEYVPGTLSGFPKGTFLSSMSKRPELKSINTIPTK